MTDDDLKDIDPEIVEAIRTNADEFVATGEFVDKIVAWGEAEIDATEKRILESGGSVEDFKKEAERIQGVVREKLKDMEEKVEKKSAL